MSANYRIGESKKFGMLSLALLFDGIQFATPVAVDIVVSLTAAVVFGIIFLESGALTLKGKGALKLLRIVLPISELVVGNLPAIFLTVWVQIKISRIVDTVLPEDLQNTVRLLARRHITKDIAYSKKRINRRLKTIQKVNERNKRYGKGRRGATAADRQQST